MSYLFILCLLFDLAQSGQGAEVGCRGLDEADGIAAASDGGERQS